MVVFGFAAFWGVLICQMTNQTEKWFEGGFEAI